MNTPSSKQRAQRITLLFWDRESTRSALQLLPLLVEERSTELYGLFVEDVDLLHLAQQPFTRELCRLTYTERPLREADIQRQLRIQARSARQSLEASAKQAGLSFSFRTTRGAVALLLQEAARDMDLVILTPRRRVPQLTGPVTLTAVAYQSSRPLVVVYDSSPQSTRALLLARRLADVGKRELIVLLASTDAGDGAVLRRQAAESITPMTARYRALAAPDVATVLQSGREQNAGTLVLGLDEGLLRPDGLQILSDYLECPVLLVS